MKNHSLQKWKLRSKKYFKKILIKIYISIKNLCVQNTSIFQRFGDNTVVISWNSGSSYSLGICCSRTSRDIIYLTYIRSLGRSIHAIHGNSGESLIAFLCCHNSIYDSSSCAMAYQTYLGWFSSESIIYLVFKDIKIITDFFVSYFSSVNISPIHIISFYDTICLSGFQLIRLEDFFFHFIHGHSPTTKKHIQLSGSRIKIFRDADTDIGKFFFIIIDNLPRDKLSGKFHSSFGKRRF